MNLWGAQLRGEGTMDSFSSLQISLIIGGVVVGFAFVALIVYFACSSKKRRRGEEDLLDGSGFSYGTENTSGWKFGELDINGVKRVVTWVSEVKAAARESGVLPLEDEYFPDASFLGQMDDIGSPPQVYTPRVSLVGSDDGDDHRDNGYTLQERDPLQYR